MLKSLDIVAVLRFAVRAVALPRTASVLIFASCLVTGLADAPAQPPTAQAKPQVSAEAPAEAPEFIRVYSQDNKPQALQTAVVTYRKPEDDSGVELTLIAAVHIGEPTYYSQLNELFKTYDALLYELVSDPGVAVPDREERGMSPVSTIQVGLQEALDLTFQLDEIDYKAKNFVHADMNPREFFDTMHARKEGLMQMFWRSMGSGIAAQSSGKGNDLDMVAALLAEDRPKAMRRAFAAQMNMMEGQMAALTGNDGKSTLITERNSKAFQAMEREIKAGKKKLAIFYGAGHLKEMHQRLVSKYGMQPVETKWLDAWELQ